MAIEAVTFDFWNTLYADEGQAFRALTRRRLDHLARALADLAHCVAGGVHVGGQTPGSHGAHQEIHGGTLLSGRGVEAHQRLQKGDGFFVSGAGRGITHG